MYFCFNIQCDLQQVWVEIYWTNQSKILRLITCKNPPFQTTFLVISPKQTTYFATSQKPPNKNKDYRFQRRIIYLSKSGSITLPNMDSDIFFQMAPQEFTSMIRLKCVWTTLDSNFFVWFQESRLCDKWYWGRKDADFLKRIRGKFGPLNIKENNPDAVL